MRPLVKVTLRAVGYVLMALTTITINRDVTATPRTSPESAGEIPEPPPHTLDDALAAEYALARSPLELAQQLSAILRRNACLANQENPAQNPYLDTWVQQERVRLQYSDPQLLATLIEQSVKTLFEADFPGARSGSNAQSAYIVGGLLCHATYRIWNARHVAPDEPLAESYNLQNVLSISADAEPTPTVTMHGWQTMARLLLQSNSTRYGSYPL